jgi:hypothetical protein
MSLYNVKLLDSGYNKIATIKALRTALAPMSLYEAKQLTDSTPVTIAWGVHSDMVESIRKALNGGAGIQVESLPQTSTPLSSQVFTNEVVNPAALPAASIQVASLPRLAIAAKDLSIGEWVYRDTNGGVSNPSNPDELRFVTSAGVYGLDGSRGAEKSSSSKNYLRFPKGTVITITI